MAAVRLLDEPRPFCLRAALRRSHDLRYRVRFPSNHAHTLSSHHVHSLLPLSRHSAPASRPAHSTPVVWPFPLNPFAPVAAGRSASTRIHPCGPLLFLAFPPAFRSNLFFL